MRLPLAALALALSPLAAAQTSGGLPPFELPAPAAVLAAPAPAAAPKAAAVDAISKHHLLVRGVKNVLVGRAETPAQLAEAVAYWSAALRTAGIVPGETTYEHGIYTLAYRAPQGRVLRDFLADPRQFPPKDEPALRDALASARGALQARGLDVVAARVVGVDALLPTYSLLYLTAPAQRPQDELALRLLKTGDDLDFDALASAPGVSLVQKAQPWLAVYIGPELGYVSLIGKTRAELDVKVAQRLAYFAERGIRVFATRVFPIVFYDYTLAAGLYFFQ